MKLEERHLYHIFCAAALFLLILVLIVPGSSGDSRQEKHGASRPETKTDGQGGNETKQGQGAKGGSLEEADGNPLIRVLLRGNGFKEEVHAYVGVSAPGGLIVAYGELQSETAPGEVFQAAADHPFLAGGAVRISAKQPGEKITVTTLTRGYGTPSYNGVLELIPAAGGVALVNELPMEQYLYGVVPSEMPAFYEMEALKCQAVSARSYVYNQMKTYAYPQYQAHVDDSVAFQVYGNSETKDSVIRAVDETAGKKLWYKGQVATTYYFSTSSGQTTDMSAWGNELNEGNAYLQSICVANDGGDFEKELPWYRWEAVVPRQTMSNLISANTKTDIGNLRHLEVTKRGAGDVVLQIQAQGDKGSVTIDTENKIRRALGGSGYCITKNDGTVIDSKELLPSAFFTIEEQPDQYIIRGGGYGHGIGMSQNGANEMAKQGMKCEEILKTFYRGVSVE